MIKTTTIEVPADAESREAFVEAINARKLRMRQEVALMAHRVGNLERLVAVDANPDDMALVVILQKRCEFAALTVKVLEDVLAQMDAA